ncbi:MAG: energy transducer TonB [Pyrinomonadaceae bacterium]
MNIAVSIISLLFLLFLSQFASGQQNQASKTRKIPYTEVVACVECGDVAIQLPRPKYPSMVGTGPHVYNGKIGVEVVIDEQGRVEKATAIFGHPFFRHMLEQESFKAVFKPMIVEGKAFKNKAVIVYEVVSRRTSKVVNIPVVSCGVCNQKAIDLPKPEYTNGAIFLNASGSIPVQILIDENGNVESAKALSGHPLLRLASEKAALKARFEPTILGGRYVKVSGTIVYNFTR